MSGSSGDKFFEAIFEAAFGKSLKINGTQFKSGGCINNAVKLRTSRGDYFLKWQSGIPEDMFQKEAEGLKLLAEAGTIKIPEVIAFGKIEGKHYLLLEDIESAPPARNYWEDYGQSLAAMHKNNSARKYGLDYDNYIGKLPQPNATSDDWIDFFIRQRLEYQLKLAIKNALVSDHLVDRYRRFYDLLPGLLPVDRPALLHGDMWSGNAMVGNDGRVCLIDPAVYYGHREIELAFSQMFGGFGNEFYKAYEEAYPLESGFEERVDIYNIYPHMVHVNLFGTSYLGGVERVLRRYL
ncbi:MAG: fructosamine kinase family protein [Cytophagales bacterium]|nr:fructosamine kinase family protein [Cytophagales bacterium]